MESKFNEEGGRETINLVHRLESQKRKKTRVPPPTPPLFFSFFSPMAFPSDLTLFIILPMYFHSFDRGEKGGGRFGHN